MQKQFLKYCLKIGLNQQSTLLLAVSGGLDSMALLHLLHSCNFEISAAHCNFNLRAKESDADQEFVKSICKDLGVPFYTKNFDTKSVAHSQGISIQMAARDIRYHWFEELRAANNFDFIATAHHQDDQIETLLINLTRGTGLKGMHGILAKQNYLLRPLLFTDKKALLSWMNNNDFDFREDQSNASLKYTRNKIRHKVLPVLKEINPSLTSTMQENAERFYGSENNLSYFYESDKSKLIKNIDNKLHFDLRLIQKYPAPVDLLFYFLSEYDFQDWKAIENLLISDTGKMISSKSHQLLKNRDSLILNKIETTDTNEYLIPEELSTIARPLNLTFKATSLADFKLSTSACIAALDFDCLQFPLLLRKWRKGDVFQPLGMKGKKKLSDFFIDQKLSIFDKSNTWVLCSGNKIVWIVGLRIDERFKLVENSQKVYLVEQNK